MTAKTPDPSEAHDVNCNSYRAGGSCDCGGGMSFSAALAAGLALPDPAPWSRPAASRERLRASAPVCSCLMYDDGDPTPRVEPDRRCSLHGERALSSEWELDDVGAVEAAVIASAELGDHPTYGEAGR